MPNNLSVIQVIPSEASETPAQAVVVMLDGQHRYLLHLKRNGRRYGCDEVSVRRMDDGELRTKDVTVPLGDLVEAAAVAVKQYHRGLAGWHTYRSRGGRMTDADLDTVAELAREADSQGLGRAAVVMRELGIPERTAYRWVREAIDRGKLEAKR